MNETRNGADLPAVSVSVPTSVCRPTASGPVLYVTRVPLITGATVPTPSSVTADGVTASLVTSSTEAAESTRAPSAGVEETTCGAVLSTRSPVRTLVDVFPEPLETTARKS